MFKVFAYAASYRNEKSFSVNMAKMLLNYLNYNLNIPVDFKFHTASDVNIEDCRGCCNCFLEQKCILNDDMESLKLEMLNSDMIIIVSPVYFHQVSGNLKTFIDRISYWCHTLELRGKIGININISTTNGNKFVGDYLNKVMYYLGLSVICTMGIQSCKISNHQAFESIIRILSIQIIDRLKNRNFPISPIQEVYFQHLKGIMDTKPNESLEKKYWEKHDLFKYNSFRELYDNYCNIVNITL